MVVPGDKENTWSSRIQFSSFLSNTFKVFLRQQRRLAPTSQRHFLNGFEEVAVTRVRILDYFLPPGC